MLGGTYYLWIMLFFFLIIVGMAMLVALVLWIGHWVHNRESGEKHGFLELPENLRAPDPAAPEPGKEKEPPS